MFKIGEFSRLTRVPIKTLRHYDEIGLFKPASVDRFTSYRYYTYDQLPTLNRILVLRDLGFTLAQIAEQVRPDNPLNVEQLRGMLRLRQAQLEEAMRETQENLAQVSLRLAQIEREGKMPKTDVLLKDLGPVIIAGARELVTDTTQMRPRCIALNDAACALIETAGLKTDGVSLALYHTVDDNGIDVEMAYGVDTASNVTLENPKAAVHILPALTVAYGVYRGSYDDFAAVGQVHGDINRWIAEYGYRVVDTPREYYLRPPQGPDDPMGVMEIQYPVMRV